MSLGDVIQMIENGTRVVLRSDNDPRIQVYHKNVQDKRLLVFITLNGYSSSLLNEGEWEYYLAKSLIATDGTECLQIKNQILTDEEIKSFGECKYYYMET